MFARLAFCVASVVSVAPCVRAQPLPEPPMGKAVADALAPRAHPLPPVDAAGDLAGFDALAPMLEGVRIVGFGESSHGSREQQQWRHALLRWLVEKQQCHTLIVECSTARVRAVDAFVRRGEGSAEGALQSLDFWPLATEEMVATLEWLRRWNADEQHTHKVAVFGMDPQQCDGVLPDAGEPKDDEDAALRRLLVAQAAADREMTGLEASMAEQWNRRDRAMAAAVVAIAAWRGPGRLLVSAHASHLRAAGGDGLDPTGRALRVQFGKELLVVSALFASGEFVAYDLPEGPEGSRDELNDLAKKSRGIVPFTVPPLGGGALADQLLGLQRSPCLYDLREPGDALVRWCRRPLRVRVLGGGFRERWATQAERVAPGALGDVLLFHDESHGAKVLPAAKK